MPNELDKDVLGKVFEFFQKPEELGKNGRVCKLWKQVSEKETLWTPFLDSYAKKKTQVSARKLVIEQIKRQKELTRLLAEPGLTQKQKQNLVDEKLKALYLHGHITLDQFKNISEYESILQHERICNLILTHYLDITEYFKAYADCAQSEQYDKFYSQQNNLLEFYSLIITLGTRFPNQKKIIVTEIQTMSLDEKNHLRDKTKQQYLLESPDAETALTRLQEIKQDNINPSPIKPK